MVRRILLAAVFAFLSRAETPAGVVAQLTKPKPDPFFSCGEVLADERVDRSLARTLVTFGVRAIPVVTETLDRYETEARSEQEQTAGITHPDFAAQTGDSQPGRVWLLYADAKIEGPAAFPRLTRFRGRHKSYAGFIDNATALALGLTSYVSSSRNTPFPTFHCDRGSEPRDPIDKLILALFKGSESEFRASLARDLPVAEGARGKFPIFSSASPGDNIAVGYTLEVEGAWSEPEETLEEGRMRGNRGEFADHASIQTRFTTRSGADCGRFNVTFSRSSITKSEWPVDYKIDNDNLADLIHLISTCAAQP